MGFRDHGGPQVLAPVELPTPTPGPGELLVRVRAAGVNPIDAKVRRGEVPAAPKPDAGPVVPGYEGAGVVEALGPGVEGFTVGQAVFFAGRIQHQGAYAQYAVADARLVASKPADLSFEEAAALPLTFLTVWESLVEDFGLSPGGASPAASKTLLVVGGAGGVGSMAISLAKNIPGLRMVATASRPASRQHCLGLGADVVLDHTQPLAQQLKAAGLTGVDFLLNNGPNDRFTELAGLLNPLGKICLLNATPELAALNVSPLRAKRCGLFFAFMFSRSLFDHEAQKQGGALRQLAAWLQEGRLASTLARVLPLADAALAHQQLDTGHAVGKTVLAVAMPPGGGENLFTPPPG